MKITTEITRDLATCIALREEVFVRGQGVAPAREVDGLDPQCTHFLVRVDGFAAATARLRVTDAGIAKAERVAVLPDYRGLGLGGAVMASLHREVLRSGKSVVELGAQVEVIEFYRKLGYVAYGDLFMDAGIEHRMMRKTL